MSSINDQSVEQLAILYEQINIIKQKCTQIIRLRNLPGPAPVYPDLTLVKASVNSSKKLGNSLSNIINYLETHHVANITLHNADHEQQSALQRLESECELQPNGAEVHQRKCEQCDYLLQSLEQQFESQLLPIRSGIKGIEHDPEPSQHDCGSRLISNGPSSVDPSRQHANDPVDEGVGCSASNGTIEPKSEP